MGEGPRAVVMSGHDGHGHGGGHDHGHSCAHEAVPLNMDDPDGGEEWSLFQKIDHGHLRGLNIEEGTVARPFKPRDERFDTSKYARSSADEQLIIHVPFTEIVKVKSICVIGPRDGEAPSELKVFVNREDVDFTSADDLAPTQAWDLVEERVDGVEYQTKLSKFSNVSSLTLYFPNNFGAELTTVYYIGFKGEFTSYKRQAVEAVYEARPVPKDHKVRDEMKAGSTLGHGF